MINKRHEGIDFNKIIKNTKELEEQFNKDNESIEDKKEVVRLFSENYYFFLQNLFKGILSNQGLFISRFRASDPLSYLMLAYQNYLLDNGEIWVKMTEDVKELGRFTYDEVIKEIYGRLPEYIQEFNLIITTIEERGLYNSLYDNIEENSILSIK